MDWKLQFPRPQDAQQFFENKMTYTLGPMEVKYYLDEGERPLIVDVRHRDDYEEGHVPGAINLPEDQWETLSGLRKDVPNIIYCYSVVCHLAAKAAVYFASKGFPVIEMDGGFEYWQKYELPTEKGPMKQVSLPDEEWPEPGEAA